MTISFICGIIGGLFIGIIIGIEVWERVIVSQYDRCIDDILAANQRLRMELSQRDNKTRVEGDEWKDG